MSNKQFFNVGEALVETSLNAFGIMTPKQISDALKKHDKEITTLNKKVRTLQEQVKQLKKKSSKSKRTKRNKRDEDFDEDDYDPL